MVSRMVGAALVTCALAACGDNGEPARGAAGGTAATAPAEVRAVASEFDFAIEEPVRPGVVRFVVRNEGEQLHHAIAYRLELGVTVEKLARTLRAGEEGVTDLAEQLGGSGPIPAGDETWFGAGEPLVPGTHVLVCYLRDQRSSTAEKTHVELGMIEPFEVR